MNKINDKSAKGVTLITLVVTIVVLMVLLGVGLSALAPNDGLINKSKDLKEEAETSSIIQKIRMDIFAAEERADRNITELELDAILQKYGEISIEEGNKILITDEGYRIKVSDIWNGTLAE